MRDYAKIGPKFWIGETGKKLRAAGKDAQIVALYLMSSPHANMLGLYYIPKMYVAYETGLGLEGASMGLARAIEAGFCEYDEVTETVWVIEMAKYQIAEVLKEKDLRIKGVQNEYDSLPTNPYLARFFDLYARSFLMTSKRGESAPEQPNQEAPSKPLASQEQEQAHEQAQEHKQEQAQAAETAARATDAVALSIAFRAVGIRTQPADPRLIALAEQGVDVDTVQAACAEAKRVKGEEQVGIGYVMKILERWAADAAALKVAGAAAPKASGAWRSSDAATIAKGAEFNLAPRAGESIFAFRDRVAAKIDGEEKPVPVRVLNAAPGPPSETPRSIKPEGLVLASLVKPPPGNAA